MIFNIYNSKQIITRNQIYRMEMAFARKTILN